MQPFRCELEIQKKFFTRVTSCKNVSFPAGYVARTCNPASGRLGVVDGLRLGVLLDRRLR